jgi:hypothetical protein
VRLTTLRPTVGRLPRENVEASTSHNPMGLHGLLLGQLHLFTFYTTWCTCTEINETNVMQQVRVGSLSSVGDMP